MRKIIFLSCFFHLMNISTIFPFEENGQIHPGKEYALMRDPIDVVIPSVEKDLETLELSIAGIKKNCADVRRVFVVSKKKFTQSAEWIDESLYPFSKEDVLRELFTLPEEAQEYVKNPNNRLGWIYQQLLKLYAPFVISDISSNVLMLDSDTIFLKNISFLNHSNAALFNVSSEHHVPYFAHMKRLLPNLVRVKAEYSGVCHHMLFQRTILSDLQSHIESCHKMPMWKAILHCIDRNELYGSSFSEYEIYFNFAMLRSEQFKIRPLKWANIYSVPGVDYSNHDGFDYISAHAHLRS